MSRTLSGLFLVGALNRPRKRKRTNRENPRTIPEQIGKIPEKSGKSQKVPKRTKKDKKGRTSPDRETPPRLKHPGLTALEYRSGLKLQSASEIATKIATKIDGEGGRIGNGPNTVSGSTVSNTELSEFFWAH